MKWRNGLGYGLVLGLVTGSVLNNQFAFASDSGADAKPLPIEDVFEDSSHITVVDSADGNSVVPLSLDPFPGVPAGVYEYTVRHERVGRIGSYTNTVTVNGDETIVETDVKIKAKVLFFTVAREEAERRQVWRHGRLVEFESRTKDGKKETHVTGRAEGDGFAVKGRDEDSVAPADVFPTNPWSMYLVRADVLMGEKSGALHPVQNLETRIETIDFHGESVEARYIMIHADRVQELWYDDRGVPIRFALDHSGDTVTFTLNQNKE